MSEERFYPVFYEWPGYFSPPDPVDDRDDGERPVCSRYPNCHGDGDESCSEFLQFKGDTACGTCNHERECH